MSEKVLNLKEVFQKVDEYEGYFKSHGYATIKRTVLDEKGEPREEIIKIPIRAISDDPVLKEFEEKHPQPQPPKVRALIDPRTGQTAAELGLSPQEAIARGCEWAWVYNYTDQEYQNKLKEWQEKRLYVILMLVFDVYDQFGLDKIDEFKESLLKLGFTPNQIAKLADDINALDFLPGSQQRMR